MEHIELAGVHSGDSACVLPPVSISPERQIEHFGVKEAVFGVRSLQEYHATIR